MFYIVLLFLLVLLILTALVVILNLGTLLSTSVHLTVFSLHLPGMPVLLLCVLGAFLGGLGLYVSSLYSARRDVAEMKKLRARIEDLERAPEKTPSGGLSAGFAPSVVPMPGFAANAPQPPSAAPASSGPGSFGAGNASAPAGPAHSGPPGPWQQPSSPPQNISPSASNNTMALPPRLFAPPQQQQQQQMGNQRPPFPHS